MPLNRSRHRWCSALMISVCWWLPAAQAEIGDTISQTPFTDEGESVASDSDLPDLGSAASQSNFSQQLAEMAKSIAEQNDTDTDTSLGHSAGLWAFNHFRDRLSDKLNQESQSLLSPYGRANVNLDVDVDGNFDGSSARLLSPLEDNKRYLLFSQVGLSRSAPGTTGSFGLGQRWNAGDWMFGYNSFLDHLFEQHLDRASFGTEAWGDYLRFSANYYLPVSGWRNSNSTTMTRMARGYDITSQGYLPFYRQLGVTVSWEQYLGDNIDAFNSGNYYHNPSALSLGVSYTPIPLVTFSASHKTGTGGESQDLFGLNVNYHFGESLAKQLSPDEVASAHSLRGSRYDAVTRSSTPVLAKRTKTQLSVFLATPPWQLTGGETLMLKLQVSPSKDIRSVHWQGDTRELSLTSPADPTDLQGWSIILPQWNNDPQASNEYHLAVTIENSQHQATSNWITLKIDQPFILPEVSDTPQFNLMAP
ncbi:YchO/YchP family invasin [Tatumella sp. UBA2305]|uniref:YchO/YchP family invasin n=1 Tax=Tatumella sp. UBA2305 TaxID=1947647 RepID=UPI0025D1245E|nr:YchO/YchP family invasin [Tatumella sp. UBA2305]